MTRDQLNYRLAGARGDLAALLAPYVVPMSALVPSSTPTPITYAARPIEPAPWEWIEGDW